MEQPWDCTLHVTQHQTKLLLSAVDGDLLKARLNNTPCHPRALLTLLEGLSLWNGQLLNVALSVDDRCPVWPGPQLFGDELWPAESQLVRFDIVRRARRKVRLSGLGDFRELQARLPRRAP
jgi:hypothetical protein